MPDVLKLPEFMVTGKGETNMRINLHVIVIGAGLTGSFVFKGNDCVSSYETGKFDPDGYYGFLILVQSVKRTLARYISGKILARTGHFYYQNF